MVGRAARVALGAGICAWLLGGCLGELSVQQPGTGGQGGAGGQGGGGSGGEPGGVDCHPAFCDATPVCSPSASCASLGWSARWGAVDQQRVHALASDGTRVALAGTYNGQSFEMGEGSPKTLPLASPNYDYEAYVTLLDGNGVATWAAPVALGIGYQPRTAYAVAFAGSDVVVAGTSSFTEGGIPDSDVFIRKFTPGMNDAIIDKATFQFGGDGLDEAVAVAASATGEFYVAGTITASSSKTVSCSAEVLPTSGMFVAGFSAAGTCQWFVQAAGNVTPTALVLQKNELRVVGHFEGTLTLPNGSAFTAKAGTTDSFILGLAHLSGAVLDSKQISAGSGKAVRAAAATSTSDGTLYIAGQLEGKTSVEPDLVSDGQLAAFVMPIGLENSWKRVFTGGQAQMLGDVAGTSLALTPAGALYFAGTFRESIDIDPASPSGTFERAGANPFLAKIDPASGELSWFDVFNGKGQTTFTRGFYVTTLQTGIVLAGNWITDFNFSEDGSKVLTIKGNGTSDEDIIAAKLTLDP
ncbi:hypothetical protein [Polyangium sp. y55x31]|uniref:hypothetical protein n=1 Tax=Polyangium sp. y55x31 TaxID=3042688 RepID=UPI0024825266|nr:hypothetical protein [Polyangium sp. y55x31]MDI1478845.1 hypothetical protein [Polyangium sp. y55x31]